MLYAKLDVAKAFDCINHDVQLHKMSYIGFNQNTLNWFKSHLSRTQVVRFNKSISTSLTVKTGIGQGTIFGPLIFIFYINDLVSVLNNFKISMYADDCILYNSVNNWDIMLAKLQPEICRVQNWFSENRMNKLFTLRKLRKYITENCSICIYKQTIFLLF